MGGSVQKKQAEVRKDLTVLSGAVARNTSAIYGIGTRLDTPIGMMYTNGGHTGASTRQ